MTADAILVAHGRILRECPSMRSLSRRTRQLKASHIAEGNVTGSWFLLRAQSVQDVYEKLAMDPLGREWELERIQVQPTEID